MAAYNFKNATSDAIGTTGADVYTVPSSKKSILIGCAVSNLTGASLPVEVKLKKAHNSVILLALSSRLI